MTLSSCDKWYERLERILTRFSGATTIEADPEVACALASLRAYREVFRQLHDARSMYVSIESLCENIDRLTARLPFAARTRVTIANDVSKTLVLPTIWPLLAYVLEQLLSNAVIAAAQQQHGQVTISAKVEATDGSRCCRINMANQGTLPESVRTSILQRRPVPSRNGQYGIGLLAAGEVLTVLKGYLSYPETPAGVVCVIAVISLDGDPSYAHSID